MMISQKKIKRFINDASCLIHYAVCLIYGFDPDWMVVKSSRDYRDVQFRENVTEFNDLYNILRRNRLHWEIIDNIFDFVDHALKNNIQVDKKLLKEIGVYMSNLIDSDLEYFKERFPYLRKKIKPQQNSKAEGLPRVSKDERDEKWREMAKKQLKDKPNLILKQLALNIYSSLEKSDPEYLKQANGKMVMLGTIERIIKKR